MQILIDDTGKYTFNAACPHVIAGSISKEIIVSAEEDAASHSQY